MSFRLLLVLAIGALASTASGQAGQVWVPLVVGVPPGKPAEVTLVAAKSGSQQTVVDVRIFGFWKQDVVVGPTVYQRIEVPGLMAYGQPGAPELPVARFRLAVPTNAAMVALTQVDELAVSNVANLNIYPEPLPGDDEEFDPTGDPGPGDPDGSDDQFVPPDPVIYGTAANWPTAAGAGPQAPMKLFDVYASVAPQAHPFYWNPVTRNLKVVTNLQLHYSHTGALVPALNIAKPVGKFTDLFLNWSAVQTNWGFNFLNYDARYLIVTLDAYVDELAPFIALKKQQGFQVTVESQSGPWLYLMASAAIGDWYAEVGGAASGKDHFCLLVGESDEIPVPHLPFPTTTTVIDIPTDDLYGSLGGFTTSESVWIGRLSVDGEADLTRQLAKIIAYQVSPEPGGGYNRALLVAHLQGAPGKYQGAHNQVVAGSYGHPPVFVTAYGASGQTNADVQFQINQDVGVVAYRGHGSTNAWSGWNLLDESFHKNQVIALMNGATHPVVWAITCTNGNLEWSNTTNSDCIAETWMEVDDIGGSASYGATITTSTKPNHELDRRLFQAVYDWELVTHAHAIGVAEELTAMAFPGTKNPWAYLLLGDPSMKIRRDVPAMISISSLGSIAPCVVPGCQVNYMVTAKAVTGAPAAGALVSLWKASAIPGLPDEILVNRYANADGVATLPISPLTPGALYVSVQDDDGNLSQKQVTVLMDDSWTDLGHGLPGTLGSPKLVGLGPLTPGSIANSVLTNVVPNSLATLVMGFSAINAPFKGGTWVPQPNVVVAGLSTGPLGSIQLPAVWPAGVPSGLEFFVQYWMHDPAGIKGYAASNAIKGTAP
jgi:hypothetical protein